MTALFIGLALYLVACVSVCATALVVGGRTERRVAIGFLVAVLATEAASVLGKTHWHGANWNVIAVDVIFLAWLTSVAVRSGKFWPLWAAASQLAGTIAHLPANLIPYFPMQLYAATQPFWAVPLLGSLLVGSVRARGKTRRLRPAAGEP